MSKTILALGADVKNRFLLAKGNAFHFGPDIGDLSEAKNFSRFKKEIAKITKRARPNIIAYDLHPNYFSSLFAKESWHNVSLVVVQHHHAHIASVIQEHNLNRPVIGVSFDGTGYGPDGNLWGGEFLLVTKARFRRLAYLKYRMLPGGDRVVYEPWRIVLSILGERASRFLNKVSKGGQNIVLRMLACEINSPRSSSAGRLFDAAAALLGICTYASSEAEGPMKLEALCDKTVNDSYKFVINQENGCRIIDTDGLFLGMLADLKKKKEKGIIASKFHNSMARIIVEMSKKISKSCGINDIVLSGGVFQNRFLKTRTVTQLSDAGFNVFTNIKTPVNDYNISLGQYYVSCCTGKNKGS